MQLFSRWQSDSFNFSGGIDQTLSSSKSSTRSIHWSQHLTQKVISYQNIANFDGVYVTLAVAPLTLSSFTDYF